MNSTECSVCGKNIKFMKYGTSDKKTICSQCFQCCLSTPSFDASLLTYDFVLSAVKNKANKLELKNIFVPTKKVSNYLSVDEKNQLWIIPEPTFGSIKQSTPYHFSDIVDFELLEDGDSIVKGGLGKSIVGAIAFGPAGAIVGGVTAKRRSKNICNSIKIKITLNSIQQPNVYINISQINTRTDSTYYKSVYKLAQECLSVLQLICNENSIEKNITSNNSVADEILKLKTLMDLGVISEEVFEDKKNILLSKI